jgi:predicted permease
LVAAAALLARTLFNLQTLATGFDIDHVALVEADPEQAQFEPRRAQDYIDQVLDRLARLPGVRAAAWARVIPLGFGGSRTSITVPGYAPAPGEDMEINFNTVSSGYFDAMGIGVIDGRAFDARDDAGGRRVAVVNRTMAARYWRGQPAVGRTFALAPTEPPIEVVGVVGDVKYRMLREEAGPSFYLPLSQERARAGVFHVRTHGDPADLLPAIRRAATEIEPTVPIVGLRTLRDQARINATDERLAMTIGFALGGAALLLAAVGLYGSMAFAVGLRTRELGVRLALGATAGDLRRLVLAHGLRLSAAGSAAGLLLAIPLARAIEARLFGVRAADLPTLAGAATVLAAVALAACWAPARRAGRVDPAGALRVD